MKIKGFISSLKSFQGGGFFLVKKKLLYRHCYAYKS